MNLSKSEKKYLLELARKVIDLKTKGKDLKREAYFSSTLKEKRGVFVTLNKSDQLRGCIGYIEGLKPLQIAVEEMSLAAAFEDPRFPPVENEELNEIEIEISILSPLKIIADPNQIEIGKHGLIIEKGMMRGLLLPQVATEYQWDVETFLAQTCQKAGLSKNAWHDESTIIQIFSAEIFSEADFISLLS
jgi:AmmeMemoRadiSam system protein A